MLFRSVQSFDHEARKQWQGMRNRAGDALVPRARARRAAPPAGHRAGAERRPARPQGPAQCDSARRFGFGARARQSPQQRGGVSGVAGRAHSFCLQPLCRHDEDRERDAASDRAGEVGRTLNVKDFDLERIFGEEGVQIWADRFDDILEDVFALQDRIANSVVSLIDATIEAVETRREIERPTGSPGAYELFLRANAATMSWDRDDMARAIVAAKESLALDPQFAWAAVLLAMCHAAFYHSQWDDNSEAHRQAAHQYLNLALRLRDDDPYVLAHGAGVLVAMGEDLEVAQNLIGRGMELNPGSALTLLYAGWVAIAADQPKEGLAHFEGSLRLDPHSKRRYALLSGKGLCLFALGRQLEAQAALVESERLAPDHTPATLGLALCYAAQGLNDEAKQAVERIKPPAALTRSIAVLQDVEKREAMHRILTEAGALLG